MKGLGIFAVVFAALIAVTPGPAQAYRSAVPTATAEVAGETADYRRNDRRYNHGRRWQRERRATRTRRYSNNWSWRTNCRTQRRNGHRERVCRRVRYRR